MKWTALILLLLAGCAWPGVDTSHLPPRPAPTNAPPKPSSTAVHNASAVALGLPVLPLVVVPPHTNPVYSFQLRPQGQTNCDLLSLLYTNSTGAASVTIGYSFATNWPCTNPPTGPSSNDLAWALQPYPLTNIVHMGSNTTVTVKFKLTNLVVTATASGPLSYASAPKGPWTVTTNRTVSVTNPVTPLYWRGTNAVVTRGAQ